MFYVKEANLESEEVSKMIKATFKKESSKDLTDEEIVELTEYIKQLIAAQWER